MRYTIDECEVKKKGYSLPELLVLLTVKTGKDISEVISGLVKKEHLIQTPTGYILTQHANDDSDAILLASEKALPTDEELEPLAIQLMSIVPQMKMAGTPYYYKCNKREITLKLKKFFKIYGNYDFEDIINATKRYVQSFNGDYRYMKLLKYFIMKDEKHIDSEGRNYVEETSLLATELENKESASTAGDSWMNELR